MPEKDINKMKFSEILQATLDRHKKRQAENTRLYKEEQARQGTTGPISINAMAARIRSEKEGPGWFGEPKRHSEAALKGLGDRGSSTVPIERPVPAGQKTIYEHIYQRLGDLGILGVNEHARFVASGFMDLHVDRIGKNRYALAHNYRHPSGDTIPDPDMEIQVFPETRMAEALSYQDTYGYQVVYPEPGKVNLKAKKSLNAFLVQWLKNIKMQGHKKAEGT